MLLSPTCRSRLILSRSRPRLMMENINKNLVDQDEYPSMTMIQTRCVSMSASMHLPSHLADELILRSPSRRPLARRVCQEGHRNCHYRIVRGRKFVPGRTEQTKSHADVPTVATTSPRSCSAVSLSRKGGRPRGKSRESRSTSLDPTSSWPRRPRSPSRSEIRLDPGLSELFLTDAICLARLRFARYFDVRVYAFRKSGRGDELTTIFPGRGPSRPGYC